MFRKKDSVLLIITVLIIALVLVVGSAFALLTDGFGLSDSVVVNLGGDLALSIVQVRQPGNTPAGSTATMTVSPDGQSASVNAKFMSTDDILEFGFIVRNTGVVSAVITDIAEEIADKWIILGGNFRQLESIIAAAGSETAEFTLLVSLNDDYFTDRTDVIVGEFTIRFIFEAYVQPSPPLPPPQFPGPGAPAAIIPEPQIPLNPDPGRFFTEYHNAFLIGTPDGTIRPYANITRAEVTTILFRLLDDDFRISVWSRTNNFTDVRDDAWFNNAISTMANAGIVRGTPGGQFRPNDSVTRAEFSAMIARFFTEFTVEQNAFTDIEGNWAEEYINLIAQFGWVQGVGDGVFNPDALMSRAEAAAIVNRMLDRVLVGPEGLIEGRTRWPDKTNIDAWYYLYMQEATHSTLFERLGNGNLNWTELLSHIDWTILETPDSRPGDIITARRIQTSAS